MAHAFQQLILIKHCVDVDGSQRIMGDRGDGSHISTVDVCEILCTEVNLPHGSFKIDDPHEVHSLAICLVE